MELDQEVSNICYQQELVVQVMLRGNADMAGDQNNMTETFLYV